MTIQNTFFSTAQTLNCGGKLLVLDTPKIMGILNVTPDSFYDGGCYHTENQALKQVEKMLLAGADIIDVGGMSSRPGAAIISVAEELKRVKPVIESITKRFPNTILSIDTVHSEVAQAAIEAGARMINDISAGKIDEKIIEVAAQHAVPYILMHLQGLPKNMQQQPTYKNVVQDILNFLVKKAAECRQKGVRDIIIDVGFGFGKTIHQNYDLLKNLADFRIMGLPILVGLSRKSMIYKLLETTPDEALNGTTVAHTLALLHGAQILRVHDVGAARETIEILNFVFEEI